MPELYLITNDDDFDLLYQKLQITLATGVVQCLQIRRKNRPKDQIRHETEQILNLTASYPISVLMNDDMAMAKEFGIGVHLGQGDGSVAQARALLGQSAVIGCTCHADLEWVKKAYQDGASYAALGAVFASPTKPQAQTLDWQVIQQAQKLGGDLCLIGGISAQNVIDLLPFGVKYIAVINDILGRDLDQIAAQCQLWQNILTQVAR